MSLSGSAVIKEAKATLFKGLNYTQNEKELILIINKPAVSAARDKLHLKKVCFWHSFFFMNMTIETTIKDVQ